MKILKLLRGRGAPVRFLILGGLGMGAVDLSAGTGDALLILHDDTPSLVEATYDLRLRYEFGEQEGLASAHAETMRNRLGLLSREAAGWRTFLEYEGTLAADRDGYNDATGRGPASRTTIADPESHEFNQGWLACAPSGSMWSLKAGRQGIDLDDQRHIGTVGWRQNMQTYDAAAMELSPGEGVSVFYGFVWQVNRVFGSEAIAPAATDFTGASHLFNARFEETPLGALTVYSYLLDLRNEDGRSNSSNSYGLRLEGDAARDWSYLLECALQTDGAGSPLDYASAYGRAELSRDLTDGTRGVVGVERLGSDGGTGYKFPLATLHKFNGFADVFLRTPADGLSDLHASISTTLGPGVKLTGTYHHFRDDGFGLALGNELDLVASKALTDRLSVLAKAAVFRGEHGQPDVNRAVVEVNFHY